MKPGGKRAGPLDFLGAIVVPAILFVGSCAAERGPESLWVQGLDARLSPGGEKGGGSVREFMRFHPLPAEGEAPPREAEVEDVWLPLERTLLLRALREAGLYGIWMHYRPTGAEERCEGGTWKEFRAVGVDGEILVGLARSRQAEPGWKRPCWHR